MAITREQRQAIGRKGGLKSRGGGVTGDPVRAAQIGSKGGSLSRRGYKLTGFDEQGKPQYIRKEDGNSTS